MRRKSSKSTGPVLPGFETCESVERTTWKPLTSSAAASPARMSASPASGLGCKGSAPPSGQSLPDSFASLGPDGCWLKTCQGFTQATLDGSLEEFCETWPRAGTMRNGTAYQQPQLVPLTAVTGSSSWPMPRSGKTTNENEETWKKRQAEGKVSTPPLTLAVKMWPTPRANKVTQVNYSEAQKRLHKCNLEDWAATPTGGQLNPPFVEWLMGFPLGWTDLDVSGTP